MITTARVDDLRVAGEGSSRAYRYPPTGEQWTSVTTITGGTRDLSFVLTPWGQKLIARYTAANLTGLLTLHTQAAEAEAQRLRSEMPELSAETVADAAEAAGQRAVLKHLTAEGERLRELKSKVGSHVHKLIEHLILWAASPAGTGSDIALPGLPDELAGAMYDDDDPVETVADWMVDGFLNWVSDFGPEFLAAEMVVFYPELRVAGTLDLIIVIRGYDLDGQGRLIAAPGHVLVLCVDVKTGKHTDPPMKEQVAVYRRAPECLVGLGEIRATPKTDGAAVLHLRPEYERGYRFMPVSRRDDAVAWNRFRRAAELYEGRAADSDKPGIPAYPLNPDGTMPARRMADMDGEGYRHVPTNLRKAGVTDLDQLAALDEAGCRALKGIGPAAMPIIREILTAHGLHLAGEAPEALATTASTGKGA